MADKVLDNNQVNIVGVVDSGNLPTVTKCLERILYH